MHKEFLMGNEAIALASIASGVNVAVGYPGTPSTEVIETISKENDGSIYVEWSVNEKAAMEVAIGASLSGARALVTMKQVGLNVASDPLMSLEYIGIKGGMVILVCDDPGPISSQTEQDTRTFGKFSKVPVFDPSTPSEAYRMVLEAFEFSEKYCTPVFFRPTTRICHAYESMDILDYSEYREIIPEGFIKDSSRYVIFPKLSYKNHALIETRNDELSTVLSKSEFNCIINKDSSSKKAIATNGISYSNVIDVLDELDLKESPKVLKVGTPFPFPEDTALEFLKSINEVLCIEELDPFIEEELLRVAGKYNLSVIIRGKKTNDISRSGENTIDLVDKYIRSFLDLSLIEVDEPNDNIELPVRPPVLCAGCPHRASFYAVKQAMKGIESFFAGDIGCYTLGNAMPLDMVDSCLCMGAGVNMAQGIYHIKPDTKCFAFVGDSTFFASAITGVVNAVYNKAELTLIILDNSTTAMTGHQPHPGNGSTLMGESGSNLSIPDVLKGLGVEYITTINPFEQEKTIKLVKEYAFLPGVKAIIMKSPCAVIVKSKPSLVINYDKCINCKKCIKEIGCPALGLSEQKVFIDTSLCTGCSLCKTICPTEAITEEEG